MNSFGGLLRIVRPIMPPAALASLQRCLRDQQADSAHAAEFVVQPRSFRAMLHRNAA